MSEETKFPKDLLPMLQSTQIIVSEIHECIHAGGNWENVQMALMGFALAIKDQTIREIKQ